MATFDTADTVLQDVATELGIGVLTNGMASLDGNAIQLRQMLKVVGKGLVRRYAWLQQRKDYVITLTTETSYALPADLLSIVDDSAWNTTRKLPIRFVTSGEWAAVSAFATLGVYDVLVRPGSGTVQVWSPTSGEVLSFEYRSKFWVKPSASAIATLEVPSAGTDVLTIDSYLLARALKYQWLADKKFDATSALMELEAALEVEEGLNAVAAPVLSVTSAIDRDPPIPNVRIGGTTTIIVDGGGGGGTNTTTYVPGLL